MLIWSKAKLKSLNVDDFNLSYDDTTLVENAKYLGIFINCDISWDFHVRRLCHSTYYHISLLRWLRRIFPINLLLEVYESYIRPSLDYGITFYCFSPQKNTLLAKREESPQQCVRNVAFKRCHFFQTTSGQPNFKHTENMFIYTIMFLCV